MSSLRPQRACCLFFLILTDTSSPGSCCCAGSVRAGCLSAPAERSPVKPPKHIAFACLQLSPPYNSNDSGQHWPAHIREIRRREKVAPSILIQARAASPAAALRAAACGGSAAAHGRTSAPGAQATTSTSGLLRNVAGPSAPAHLLHTSKRVEVGLGISTQISAQTCCCPTSRATRHQRSPCARTHARTRTHPSTPHRHQVASPPPTMQQEFEAVRCWVWKASRLHVHEREPVHRHDEHTRPPVRARAPVQSHPPPSCSPILVGQQAARPHAQTPLTHALVAPHARSSVQWRTAICLTAG